MPLADAPRARAASAATRAGAVSAATAYEALGRPIDPSSGSGLSPATGGLQHRLDTYNP